LFYFCKMRMFLKGLFYRLFSQKAIERFCDLTEKSENVEGIQQLKLLLSKKNVDRYLLSYCLTKGLCEDKKKFAPYWKIFLNLTHSNGGHGVQQSNFSPVYTLNFLKEDAYEVCFVVNKRCFNRRYICIELEVQQKEQGHHLTGAKYTKMKTDNPDTSRYYLKFKNDFWKNPTLSFSVVLTDSTTFILSNCSGTKKDVLLHDSYKLTDFGR
jgi:hypothetical protein